MDEDEYENLPPSSTMVTHMLAGAAAGVMEHTIMYPVDCVKTRMQCLVPDPRANYRNVGDALVRIVRYEGVRNTLRGINVVVGAAGPAHALYFACYEKIKKHLHTSMPGNPIVPVAGVFATLLHDATMNPADVVKQRMQVYDSPYKTCLECARSVLRTEGPKAFYRSYVTQLTMNIPFQSTHFVFYELCQDRLNKERQYKPTSHMASGAIAGAMAAGLTTPLDVCKTLLNTQERCAVARSQTSSINGLVHAARTIYEFRGLTGFFKGLTARVIYQMPSTAISWSVYEFFKYFISRRNSGASCDHSGHHSGLVPPVQVHAVSSRQPTP